MSEAKKSQNKIPAFLNNDFKINHPESSQVEWIVGKSSYTVSFREDGSFNLLKYDKTGQLNKRYVSISIDSLPTTLSRKILAHRIGIHLNHLMIDRKNKVYSLLVNDDSKYINLEFDSDGNLIDETSY